MDTSLYEKGLSDNDVPIKVMCRFRPIIEQYEEDSEAPITYYDDLVSVNVASKIYTFDRIFIPETSQEEIYLEAAKPIVTDVLNGYNGTIFAYGQTSSGKTHTIEGSLHEDNMKGILPRIIDDVFSYIDLAPETTEFIIKVSYLESYMEKIRDLLDSTRINLPVHEDNQKIPYVKGATELFVTCPEDVFSALTKGQSNRAVATTNMNEYSSRSHSVFLLQIKQTDTITKASLTGKLYVVDLAGSEKVSKTKAEGITLSEAKNINKSLSALGNVISTLADGLKKSHIPYRDSKLTRILQQSLGGNARTSILLCCSPSISNISETKSTLLFGQRAKTIKNHVHVNKELPADEWKRLYEKEKAKRMALQSQNSLQSPTTPTTADGKELTDMLSNESMLFDVPIQNNTDPCPYCNRVGLNIRQEILNRISSLTLQAPERQAKIEKKCEDCERYRDKYELLYDELDEKDEEIHRKSQLVLEMEASLKQHQQTETSLRDDIQTVYSEYQALKNQHNKTKDQINEFESAIFELVLQFRQINEDAEKYHQDKSRLEQQLQSAQEAIASKEKELSNIKDRYQHSRKDNIDFVLNLFNDLEHVDTAIEKSSQLDLLSPMLALPQSRSMGGGLHRYNKRSATFHGLTQKFKSTSNLVHIPDEPASPDDTTLSSDEEKTNLTRFNSYCNLTESITDTGYTGGAHFQNKVQQLRQRLASALENDYTPAIPDYYTSFTPGRVFRGKPAKSGRSFSVLQRASRNKAKILPSPLRGGTPSS